MLCGQHIPRKISNIVELMILVALVEDFPPEPDRFIFPMGRFFWMEPLRRRPNNRPQTVSPVAYNPNAPQPVLWLKFLDGLLYPEDIPTLQEYNRLLPDSQQQGTANDGD